jgi:plasmid stability protein
MAQLVVRKLDDDVKERLRERAARHGHSMEEEVREILLAAVLADDSEEYGLGTRIAALFADIPPGPPLVIEEIRGYWGPPVTFDEYADDDETEA